MTTRILGGIVFAAALLITGLQDIEARGIRTDTGNSTGATNGNGWLPLCGFPSNPAGCLTGGLPLAPTLPDGLLINPFSTSDPVPVASIAGGMPVSLAPTIVYAGWTAPFDPSVSLIPANSDPSGYDDAQTYPPTVLSINSYYQTNNVLGLDFEWWSTGANAPFAQVMFFNLGSPPPAVNPGDPDTTIYDSGGSARGSASGAWEIEFNCGNAGCANGASLLWDGTMYTASPNVLSTNSITVGGVTIASPAGETLLNEFVFNNGVLYPPPGWTAIAIAVPAGLVTSSGSGSVTLTWTPTAGASSYNVYQSTVSGSEGSTPVNTGITTGNVQISGLTGGRKYFFTVSAVYNGVESGQSPEVTATVLAATPTGLKATANAASIALQWTDSAGATSYSLYQGSSSGGELATPIATGITGTSYSVSGLTPGQAYFFNVVAVDAGGNTVASNEATTTVLAAAPTALSATAGNGSVTLNWSASTGASSYNIYQGTSAGGEGSGAATSATTTSTTISGLTNGQTYFFKVAAADAGGVSAQSNEASAAPAAPPPPAAPASGGGGGGVIDLIDLWAVSGLVLFSLGRKRSRG